MTLSNAPAVDKCRCPIAKADYEVEGELGTTVTCPDCHLEEVTTQKPDDTEQPGVKQASLPDEQRVYIAFKGSTSLKKIAHRNPSDQSIISAIKKRKKTQQPVRKLINEYGIPTLVTSLRFLIDQEIFASMDAARCRFPDLFLEEQASPRPEEEQETATGHLPTKEIEPLDGECNQSNEADGGFVPFLTQMQLLLEHACFAFGQREMQQELDKWDCSCAEAVSLQTWIDLFRNNKTFETEDNAGSLSNLLSSVGKIQNIVIHRLDLNFFQINQFLLDAEEFVRLLDTPIYLDAVKPLRGRIDEVLLMANRDAASIHNEADRKVAEIEAQREKLNQEEEDVKRHQSESLKNIRDSIERDIFAAMGQAKDVLPDIGLAENSVTS
ncbi:unnamed protein product [Fusarium graminearum]|nr:unnamed protein product [Fusarium graminearum]